MISQFDMFMETCRLAVDASSTLTHAMAAAKLTRADIAKRLNITTYQVDKVLDGDTKLTLELMAKFGLACGVRWKFVGVDATDSSKVIVQ